MVHTLIKLHLGQHRYGRCGSSSPRFGLIEKSIGQPEARFEPEQAVQVPGVRFRRPFVQCVLNLTLRTVVHSRHYNAQMPSLILLCDSLRSQNVRAMRSKSCDLIRTGSFVIALTVQTPERVHYYQILKQRISGQAGTDIRDDDIAGDSILEPLIIAFAESRLRLR